MSTESVTEAKPVIRRPRSPLQAALQNVARISTEMASSRTQLAKAQIRVTELVKELTALGAAFTAAETEYQRLRKEVTG